MGLSDVVKGRAAELGRAARAAVWRARTVTEVAWRTGLTASLRLPGIAVLARELPRGKSNPSLIFRFQAKNDPHRMAMVGARASGGERAWSYYEMNDALDRVATALARRGLRKG